MLVVFNLTTGLFGATKGYLYGLAAYWCYCLFFIFIFSKSDVLVSQLKFAIHSKNAIFYLLLVFSPLAGAFYVNFLPYIGLITYQIVVLVLVTSVINGAVEELYWRGLYMVEFPKNILVGVWLATLLFGLWHIAIFSISEISFGGFLPLVFGSTLMGLLWAFCSRKLQSISPSIIAHIFVNTFAFTGLYIENSF
jgi:membrane protease YdiL (CAAX protease family)